MCIGILNRFFALIKLYQYMYNQFFGRCYYKAYLSRCILWKPYISLSIPTIKYTTILNDNIFTPQIRGPKHATHLL